MKPTHSEIRAMTDAELEAAHADLREVASYVVMEQNVRSAADAGICEPSHAGIPIEARMMEVGG